MVNPPPLVLHFVVALEGRKPHPLDVELVIVDRSGDIDTALARVRRALVEELERRERT